MTIWMIFSRKKVRLENEKKKRIIVELYFLLAEEGHDTKHK